MKCKNCQHKVTHVACKEAGTIVLTHSGGNRVCHCGCITPELERKITLEIFYSDKGLQYEDYSYESDDKLETRDICFLVQMAMRELLDEINEVKE